MNKKQLFKKMWIDFDKRLPPETDDEILIYIDMIGCVQVTLSHVARRQHIQMQDKIFKKRLNRDKDQFKHTGYFADMWMKIYRPGD